MKKHIAIIIFATMLLTVCLTQYVHAYGNIEEVYVYKVVDRDYQAIIIRANGEVYLIEYGVGVISLSLYEGRTVYVYSPTLFAGISSKIMIPDMNQEAIIWDSELIDRVSPIPTNSPTPITPIESPTATQAAPKTSTVFVNGSPLSSNVPPIIVGGRTFVPLRGIFEALGASVVWNAEEKSISAIKNYSNSQVSSISVFVRVGSVEAQRKAILNDGQEEIESVALDVPPLVVEGTTWIPLRFIAESLGASVEYNKSTQNVYINY